MQYNQIAYCIQLMLHTIGHHKLADIASDSKCQLTFLRSAVHAALLFYTALLVLVIWLDIFMAFAHTQQFMRSTDTFFPANDIQLEL